MVGWMYVWIYGYMNRCLNKCLTGDPFSWKIHPKPQHQNTCMVQCSSSIRYDRLRYPLLSLPLLFHTPLFVPFLTEQSLSMYPHQTAVMREKRPPNSVFCVCVSMWKRGGSSVGESALFWKIWEHRQNHITLVFDMHVRGWIILDSTKLQLIS